MSNNDIEQKAIEYANNNSNTIDEYWAIIEQGLIWGVNPLTGEPDSQDTPQHVYISELARLIKSDE